MTLLLMFIHMPFPIQPIQLSLISSLTIGLPSFFLALEPNYSRVSGKFMVNVIRRAMPGGLTNIILVLLSGFFVSLFKLPESDLNTISVWIIATVGFVTLFYVSKPFSKLRIIIFVVALAAMLIAVFAFSGFFEIAALSSRSILILVLLMICCPTLYRFFLFIFDRQMRNRSLKKLK